MTEIGSLDVRVRLAIQRAFIAGGPTPTTASVGAELDVPHADVAAAFDRLAAGRVIVLVPGTRDLMMSAPFAGRATDFAVTVGERTYSANCIWDALGVAAVDALWRLAQLWFHDRLSPAWRRRTIDEAHAIFAAAGLTGEFWRLDV